MATHYASQPTNPLRLRLRLDADVAALVVEESADLGSARDVLLFALAIGLWRIGCALTGRDLRGSIELAFAEPPYAAKLLVRHPVILPHRGRTGIRQVPVVHRGARCVMETGESYDGNEDRPWTTAST